MGPVPRRRRRSILASKLEAVSFRPLGSCAVALALASLAVAPPAHARGLSEFTFRVDLARGTSSEVRTWTWPDRNPPTRDAEAARWWKPSADAQPPFIEVCVETAEDNEEEAPRGPRPSPAIVVSAGHRERLRLPGPIGKGQLVWYALEGDVLVIAWRASNGRADEGSLAGPEQVWGVDLGRGAVRWRRVSLEPSERALAAGDGRVLVVGRAGFTAIESATGRVAWQLPRTDANVDPLPQLCPITASRWLVITTEIRAVDTSGHLLWTLPTGERQTVQCRAGSGRVFVAVQSRTQGVIASNVAVMALDAADGRILWQIHVDGSLMDIALVDGSLAVTTQRGLIRLETADGRIAWKLDGLASEVQLVSHGDWFLPGSCARVDSRTGTVRWRMAGPCAQVGEALLLRVDIEDVDSERHRVWLLQYSFADRRLLRRDLVQPYRGFADAGRASVVAARNGVAYVQSAWTVFD